MPSGGGETGWHRIPKQRVSGQLVFLEYPCPDVRAGIRARQQAAGGRIAVNAYPPKQSARLLEESVKLGQDRRHVGRPGGPGRDVDAFSEERGVQRIKTSPKLDGLHGR